ncbi:MAG: hypothetical protein AAFV77_05810 [Planctomycetota bacterium]
MSQWIQNNLPLVILIAAFGVSGLGWLLRSKRTEQRNETGPE